MKLLSLLFFASLAFGQTANKIAPDCDIQFTLTSASSSPTTAGSCAQNLQGVRFWSVIYQSNGFSGLTLTMQEAPDSNGSPGSWTTFTAASGTNPMTSTTGLNADTTYLDYAPWVRVTLSGLSGSGTVTGHLYGCKQPGCGSGGSGSGGGGGSGCVGSVATPCQIGVDNAGTSLPALGDVNGRLQLGALPLTAAPSGSSSGLVQVIAANAGKTTTISHWDVLFASGATFQLEYGTGSNCGTGTTAITAQYPSSFLGNSIDIPFVVPASQAVCYSIGSSIVWGGFLVYSQP